MAKSRLKPLPKTPLDISQEEIKPYLTNEGKAISQTPFNRNKGYDYSMKDDEVKDISIGLEDIDNAIMYYFKNVIKPNVIQNGQRLEVPVLYGSPELWKSVQADGWYRDKNGKLMVPLIVFKRNNIVKNRELGNKLDGNNVNLYQIVGTKYNRRNAYDKFSVLNNRIPSEQYYVSAVPDYITVNYSCIIFTDYVEQNNKLVEAVQFASDSYWGDPNRFKFKSRIDTIATTTILEQGEDRAAKSTFDITVNGYIIPDTINKTLATARSKFYTKAQVVFDVEVVDSKGVISDFDNLQFANSAPKQNSMGATSFVGGGINYTNINNTYNIDPAASGDLNYLNTNNIATGSAITGDTAVFAGKTFVQPPSGSSIPPTSLVNFSFFINGQFMSNDNVISFNQVGSNSVLVVNTGSLQYTLSPTDQIAVVGKIQ